VNRFYKVIWFARLGSASIGVACYRLLFY